MPLILSNKQSYKVKQSQVTYKHFIINAIKYSDKSCLFYSCIGTFVKHFWSDTDQRYEIPTLKSRVCKFVGFFQIT